MEILLVGQADSIFFEHYTKTIKKLRPDINFDVFSVDSIHGKYDLSACNKITVNDWEKSFFRKMKGLRIIIKPFYTWLSLYNSLRKNDKYYDIIHYKWLIPGVILFPGKIKKYSNKTVATFWGNETEMQSLLFSNKFYKFVIKHFVRKSDAIINQSQKVKQYILHVTGSTNKYYFAKYGSSIIHQLDKLQKSSESRKTSKNKYGIPEEKITISIGYSGKKIHNHILIIQTLFDSGEFNLQKELFHFILPMNYGCGRDYATEIENIIKQYTSQYTILYPQKYSDEEIARLRNATDLMIQLSKSDGLSASVIETFYAGSLVISGSWLPYDTFKQNGLYFNELSGIDGELPQLILNISKDIAEELKKSHQNKTRWNYDSWEKVIPNWIDIYEKVLQES